MKLILSSAFCALVVLLAAVPASAQSRLKLPSNLFAVGQAPSGQAPAVQLPVRPPDSNGPRVSLTLEDAVTRALENNLDIAVQRIGQQVYDVNYASIRSVYSPTVSSLIQNQSSKNASTSTISGGQTGATINNTAFVFNGGLVQDVPWGGGSFSAALDNRRSATSNRTATINPQYSPTWSAQYTQPLLRDFKIDATRQQLLVTRINQDISDIQLQQTTMNTVANVRNAYWDYVFAVQSVDVARQSLLLAEELLRNNQTKVEIGTMAPIDVVQAQSQAAQQRQAVVTAEGTRRTAEIALKRLIVSGTSDPLWTATIEPVDRPDFRPEPIDLTTATQRALSARTDVQQVRKNLEANDITLRLLQNQKLPQVDLQTRYATTGVGGNRLITSGSGVDRGEIIGIEPGGYLDALDMLFSNRLPTWSMALNISYNLGTSAADASLARARIQQSQIEVQLRQLDLQVTSDVSNAAILVQNAAERVQAAASSRDLAQQQLDAENSKFGVGMSTNYQVVLAQRDLATAQNNELQAVLAYRKAVVDFERVQQTGTAGNIAVISR
jgi:outer membrane protein TolC